MATFDDFLSELKGEVKDLVEKSWADLKGSATKDANEFIKATAEDLKRWTSLMADGSLTIQEFEFLVGAKKDLAKMTALKKAGLAKVQADRFFYSLVGTVVNAATKSFL